MAELCTPKKWNVLFVCLFVCFLFDFNAFLAGKRYRKIDRKIKISRYGETNNFKRPRRDRMKCFEKAQLVKKSY